MSLTRAIAIVVDIVVGCYYHYNYCYFNTAACTVTVTVQRSNRNFLKSHVMCAGVINTTKQSNEEKNR